MVSAAPVVFFTTTGAPSMAVNSPVRRRTTMPAAEAGPKLVTMVIGGCALAGGMEDHAGADGQAATAARASLRSLRLTPSRFAGC